MEVRGRIDRPGNEVEPLAADDVEAGAERLKGGCRSHRGVALWSIVNPAHERRVAEIMSMANGRACRSLLGHAQPDPARVPARHICRIDAASGRS